MFVSIPISMRRQPLWMGGLILSGFKGDFSYLFAFIFNIFNAFYRALSLGKFLNK